MTQLETKLNDIETRIHATPSELREVFSAKIALAAARSILEGKGLAEILHQAREHIHPQLDAAAGASHIRDWLRRGSAKESEQLAALGAAADAVANHPLHGEAVKILVPLLAERDRLREAVEAERLEIEKAREAAETAVREAEVRAAAAAAADPGVAAAKAALHALEHPPAAPPVRPFRGKVAVATEV